MMKTWIFDARLISGGYSGIARYTSSVLIGLLRIPNLFGRLIILLEEDYDYSGNKNFNLIKTHLSENTEIVKLKAPPFSFRHHLNVSKFVNRIKPDLYFYPHFDVPYGIKVPTAFVIHDLFPFYLPNYFGWRNNLMKLYYLITIRKALNRNPIQLITISNASKSCIKDIFESRLKIDPRVVYETSPITFQQKTSVQSKDLKGNKYLLYVGCRRPNKNLRFMVETFKELRNGFGYQGRLKIVGDSKNWDYNLNHASQQYDFIELVDEVSDKELYYLYENMDALFYPSLYEGFGLPIVEAAACKKKIITSNRSSMKEISPSWSLLIDPEENDYYHIAKQIDGYLKAEINISIDSYYFCHLQWEQIASQIFSTIAEK